MYITLPSFKRKKPDEDDPTLNFENLLIRIVKKSKNGRSNRYYLEQYTSLLGFKYWKTVKKGTLRDIWLKSTSTEWMTIYHKMGGESGFFPISEKAYFRKEEHAEMAARCYAQYIKNKKNFKSEIEVIGYVRG